MKTHTIGRVKVVSIATESFGHSMTAWAQGVGASGHSLVMLTRGNEDTHVRRTGEDFDRYVATAGSWDRTLYHLAYDADVINCQILPSLSGIDLPIAHSLYRHNPYPAVRAHLAVTCTPEEAEQRWSDEVELIEHQTRLAAPSHYALGVDAEIFRVPGDVVYPFAPKWLAERPREEVRAPVPVWVGRPVLRKGLGWLMEHAPEWSFSFQWAGNLEAVGADPRNREMVEAATQYAAPVADPRNLSQMCDVYERFPVVLCPYLDEPFGMVVPEALAAGCRVVAFSSGGIPEMSPLEGLTLVPPLDVAAFDEAVCAALAAPPLLPEQRHHATEKFSEESSVASFVAHLENTLSSFRSNNQTH